MYGLFQHTAARRRLVYLSRFFSNHQIVSTHSRPKAAGTSWLRSKNRRLVSTHSRPKAAGVVNGFAFGLFGKFQHTAARRRLEVAFEKVGSQAVFQHTAARRRLGPNRQSHCDDVEFQHTAARRRLDRYNMLSSYFDCFNTQPPEGGWPYKAKQPETVATVSTHSRPKAAGMYCQEKSHRLRNGFNTQPPEGGWGFSKTKCLEFVEFQHTAARRRLVP